VDWGGLAWIEVDWGGLRYRPGARTAAALAYLLGQRDQICRSSHARHPSLAGQGSPWRECWRRETRCGRQRGSRRRSGSLHWGRRCGGFFCRRSRSRRRAWPGSNAGRACVTRHAHGTRSCRHRAGGAARRLRERGSTREHAGSTWEHVGARGGARVLRPTLASGLPGSGGGAPRGFGAAFEPKAPCRRALSLSHAHPSSSPDMPPCARLLVAF